MKVFAKINEVFHKKNSILDVLLDSEYASDDSKKHKRLKYCNFKISNLPRKMYVCNVYIEQNKSSSKKIFSVLHNLFLLKRHGQTFLSTKERCFLILKKFGEDKWRATLSALSYRFSRHFWNKIGIKFISKS